MRKLAALSAVALMSVGLVSCVGGTESSQPTFVLEGKMWFNNIGFEEELTDITVAGICKKVQDADSFVLYVNDKHSTCTCHADFQSVIKNYVTKRSAMVYEIALEDVLDNDFGIEAELGKDAIVIFENGKVKHQRNSSDSSDPFTSSKEYFLDWMDERVRFGDFIQIERSNIDFLHNWNSNYFLAFMSSSCPDCALLKERVLEPFFKEKERKTCFFVDGDLVKKELGEVGWQMMKNVWGLTPSGFSDFGYGYGYVPTIGYYKPRTHAPSSLTTAIDMVVYLNDEVMQDENGFYVSSSFFNGVRNANSYYPMHETVLEGKRLDDDDVLWVPGGDKAVWKTESKVEFYDPLIKSFLDFYLTIEE